MSDLVAIDKEIARNEAIVFDLGDRIVRFADDCDLLIRVQPPNVDHQLWVIRFERSVLSKELRIHMGALAKLDALRAKALASGCRR